MQKKKHPNKYLRLAPWLIFFFVSSWEFLKGQAATIAYLSDTQVVTIRIRPGHATILNFPTKPKKVVKGSSAFDIKYINNDLAITALSQSVQSNIFVYLDGRRYGFSLKTTLNGPFDEVVIVKDKREKNEKVRVKILDE